MATKEEIEALIRQASAMHCAEEPLELFPSEITVQPPATRDPPLLTHPVLEFERDLTSIPVNRHDVLERLEWQPEQTDHLTSQRDRARGKSRTTSLTITEISLDEQRKSEAEQAMSTRCK
ncbi:hypothetical protein PanWU01x14_357720 [Parasponia andersonii]|uniref:Uncharacterized protein n=1 Tax=Parasponia andersonii TaxID=3476 RepID=A0A2P5A8G7_PARAD|nr:hypothetical protein PanWU01x14_357720 [Parasponia andersonii]